MRLGRETVDYDGQYYNHVNNSHTGVKVMKVLTHMDLKRLNVFPT